MRYKPSFILYEHNPPNEGLLAMNRVFVDKRGYDYELVKTLIVKYPYILGKTEEELEGYFTTLEKYGLTE